MATAEYASDETPTHPEHRSGVPAALLIGSPVNIVERARVAGARMQVFVMGADIAGAREMVARYTPKVILIQEDVFDFDPAGFKSLAASANALLFRLPPGDLSVEKLEVALARSLGRSGTRAKPIP